MSSNIPYGELFFSRTKDFLDIFMARQQNNSPQTIKAYRYSLTCFYIYVTEECGFNVLKFRFEDCTYELVLSYSQYLQETRNLSASTVNQRIAALKSYLKYVADGDISLMQVYLAISKVPLLRVPKRQHPVLEKEELQIFLNLPMDSKIGNRDRIILILLFDTAIRADELLNIELGDILLDVNFPSILIHGKGRKERTVSMNDRTAEHLRSYIRHYHSPDAPPGTPLFYTVIHGQMNRMSERNLERIVKKYGDQLRQQCPDAPESLYPHLMRRTRATGMYRDGVPLEMISAILGHSSTETTRIYAIPSPDQLRDAMEKGFPSSSDQEKLWAGRGEEIRRMFGLT